MKAQLISDIHTEMYLSPMDMVKALDIAPDLDVIFLVGDIVAPGYQGIRECHDVFHYLGSKAKYVLYLTGNHEYYNTSSKSKVDELLISILPENFTWLNNSDITIEGVHFYGGTMWFPDDPLNYLYESELNDFSLIKDIRDWVYFSNTEFRTNAWRNITKDTVVLTHHLPCTLSTPPQFRGDQSNRFFVSDESRLIMTVQPRLWLHGHTHHSCDYTVGDTRVVCYPHGYPKERKHMPPYKALVFEL